MGNLLESVRSCRLQTLQSCQVSTCTVTSGLNVQSAVAFKLFSPVRSVLAPLCLLTAFLFMCNFVVTFYCHFRHPVTFTASFVNGSDPEFEVLPSAGELLPQGTSGTLFKITFLPPKYGKLYQGTLLVKVSYMYFGRLIVLLHCDLDRFNVNNSFELARSFIRFLKSRYAHSKLLALVKSFFKKC